MQKLTGLVCLLVFAAAPLLAQKAPGNPKAIIETTKGNFTCELFHDKVPNAVDNFVGLAEGTKDWINPVSRAKKHGVPLYDGTIFHRVIPEFMIQGGDPQGDGSGEIGVKLNDEFVPELKFDRPGRLAYANSGPNTNGSQFFITEIAVPSLDPCVDAKGCIRGNRRVAKGYGYTIFGQCQPASLVAQIARVPRDPNDKPFRTVKINHVKILKPGETASGGALAKTAGQKTETKKSAATKK